MAPDDGERPRDRQAPETLVLQRCQRGESLRCLGTAPEKAVIGGDGWPQRRASRSSPASTGAETPPARVRRFRRGAAPTPRLECAQDNQGGAYGQSGMAGGKRSIGDGLGRHRLRPDGDAQRTRPRKKRPSGVPNDRARHGDRAGASSASERAVNRRNPVEARKPAARRGPQDGSTGIPVHQRTGIPQDRQRLGASIDSLPS